MFSSENVNELFTAFSKAQGEFKSIPFDKKNPHFGNKYASLSATLDAVREPLAKHNLAIIQSVQSDENGYFVCTRLIHSSGQFIGSQMKLLIDKNNMQGMGSATTYAKRYAVQAMLGVSGDEDDDANEASKPQQKHNDNNSQQARPKVEPVDFVLNLGSIKDQKLGSLSLDKLKEVGEWLSNAIKKDPKGKSAKYYGMVYGNVKKVIDIFEQTKTPMFDQKKSPQLDQSHPQRSMQSTQTQTTNLETQGFDSPMPDYDNHYQLEPENPFESFDQPTKSLTPENQGDYVIKLQNPEVSSFKGKKIKDLSPKDAGLLIAILEAKLKEIPKIENATDVFIVRNVVLDFFGG